MSVAVTPVVIKRLTTIPVYRSAFLEQHVITEAPMPLRILNATATTTVGPNDIAETSLFSATIPGRLLGTSGRLYGNILGNSDSDAGTNFTFRIKFGGTTFATLINNPSSATAKAVLVDFTVINKGSAAVNEGWGRYSQESIAGDALDFGSGTVDTTANQTLQVTGQWGGIADPDRIMRVSYVDVFLVLAT